MMVDHTDLSFVRALLSLSLSLSIQVQTATWMHANNGGRKVGMETSQ